MLIVRLIPMGIAAALLLACAKTVNSQSKNGSLTKLAGSEWAFNTGDTGPWIQFSDAGEISGSGGCNNFFGTYELNGERLILGPIASTKKACFGPGMDQETAFFETLNNVHHISATHSELILYNIDNEVLATLIRRDWD